MGDVVLMNSVGSTRDGAQSDDAPRADLRVLPFKRPEKAPETIRTVADKMREDPDSVSCADVCSVLDLLGDEIRALAMRFWTFEDRLALIQIEQPRRSVRRVRRSAPQGGGSAR